MENYKAESFILTQECSSKDLKCSHQFFIFIFHLQPGSDTIPGVKESSSLALFCQIVYEDTNKVDGEKDDDVGSNLLPLSEKSQLRVHDNNANDGVEA